MQGPNATTTLQPEWNVGLLHFSTRDPVRVQENGPSQFRPATDSCRHTLVAVGYPSSPMAIVSRGVSAHDSNSAELVITTYPTGHGRSRSRHLGHGYESQVAQCTHGSGANGGAAEAIPMLPRRHGLDSTAIFASILSWRGPICEQGLHSYHRKPRQSSLWH